MPRKKFFSFKVLGVPVGTVLVIAIPLLVINFRGEQYVENPFEAIEHGEEHNNQIIIIEARKDLMQDDSLNLDYHFNYVEMVSSRKWPLATKDLREWYKSFKSNEDTDISDIAYLMEGFIDYYFGYRINYSNTFDEVENPELKYLNFGYGLVYYDENNLEEAERFFFKELENDGFGEGAVAYLIQIYNYQDDKEAIRSLAYNELSSPYLHSSYKMDTYFEDGAWISYFAEVLDRHYQKLNLFGFIGALLASIIWIVYLRSLDVFDAEKWRHVLIMFLMGTAFVFLVYPFSDLLRYYVNISFGGSWINDLTYTSLVIGLVEEVVKFLPWFFLLKFTKIIDEPFDYILYASLSASGFAFAENLIYFQELDLHIIFTRTTFCIVGHMFWASIIAYSFVLYKYKYKKAKNKYYLIPLGFIIAAFFHGFYDFLIFYNLGALSILFFLGSLHLFVVFQNNALNLSNHFSHQIQLNTRKIGVNLIFGLLAVFMYQYVVIGLRYGNDDANEMIAYSAIPVSFMLAYLTYTFTQLKIVKGVWNKIQLPKWITAGRPKFIDLTMGSKSERELFARKENLSGTQLRFFAPKDNPYVGKQLPVTGMLLHKITVSADDNWYLVELEKAISLNGYLETKVIVRHKNEGQSLSMDKVLVYFMMIPSEYILTKESLLTRDLIFTGRVYSRPI